MDLRPRALIQRLNDAAAHGESEPTEGQAQAEPTPAAPPAPAPAPAATVPAQPKTLRIGERAPNWWEPKRVIVGHDDGDGEPCTHPNPRTARVGSTDQFVPYWCPDCKTALHADVPDDEPKASTPSPAAAHAKDCEHPNPHAVRARPTGQLVAFWCADCQTQLPVPDDYDELADVEDGEGDDGDDVPAKVRRQWSMRGSGKKTYSRPVYGTCSSPKKSLIEAWGGLRPATRHGLYNGTALALAWPLNLPQFFTEETAYLVHTYHSWTNFYVCIWYGVAAAIWTLDHRTRNWLPPFALIARMPLISLVVGVLLYGNPL